jgi:hypothetical protein
MGFFGEARLAQVAVAGLCTLIPFSQPLSEWVCK